DRGVAIVWGRCCWRLGERVMQRIRSGPFSRSALVAAMVAALLPAHGMAAAPCSGHQILTTPRPEGSCLRVEQKIYPSPDKALRAVVLPVDVSLYATPD